jgi:hypothetical protein
MAVACCASARAQTLTGTATITDADTIVIGGEIIRLQGVDAPETDQICLDSRGGLWNCGIDARDRLIRHIGSRETSCATTAKMLLVGGSRPAHKRGGPGCVANSRRPRLGFHPIFQRQHCDLGLYKPIEEQERLLLPSTSQLQPKPSLAPLPQLQEQTVACVIKVNQFQLRAHLPRARTTLLRQDPNQRGKGKRWFCTEQEAVGAGWRKAKV